MNKILKKLSLLLPFYLVNYCYFVLRHRYFPDFKTPRSFSEKINYIKLFNRNSLRAVVTDRIWVREYVSKKNPDISLVSLLWVGENFNESTWDELPEKFVIKANHGSRMVKLVDKKVDSFIDVKMLTQEWLENDYAKYGGEWFYDKLGRYLIVEELLLFDGMVPPDFKFFCFMGRVELVQVDLDRFGTHKRNLYDRKFKKLDAKLVYPSGNACEKPERYEDAVKVAEALSVDFDFIRVDLYLLGDKIYFGELTNTPEGGGGKITPKAFDFQLGEILPDVIIR